MNRINIGIIGDYAPNLPSHRDTEAALAHAADAHGVGMALQWLPTAHLEGTVGTEFLSGYDGILCAPGSPYKSDTGALDGIAYCRRNNRPFLGT
ncbi:MAG: hypothetical protein HKM93_19515 [Desulfobacteraceae bacterium]|nr:hypothetical protein [Desulfobacteraceae bacterium]